MYKLIYHYRSVAVFKFKDNPFENQSNHLNNTKIKSLDMNLLKSMMIKIKIEPEETLYLFLKYGGLEVLERLIRKISMKKAK